MSVTPFGNSDYSSVIVSTPTDFNVSSKTAFKCETPSTTDNTFTTAEVTPTGESSPYVAEVLAPTTTYCPGNSLKDATYGEGSKIVFPGKLSGYTVDTYNGPSADADAEADTPAKIGGVVIKFKSPKADTPAEKTVTLKFDMVVFPAAVGNCALYSVKDKKKETQTGTITITPASRSVVATFTPLKDETNYEIHCPNLVVSKYANGDVAATHGGFALSDGTADAVYASKLETKNPINSASFAGVLAAGVIAAASVAALIF